MINLIPPEGHKQVRREYLSRVAAVFALLVTGALVGGACLLLPSYILLSYQLKAQVESAASPEVESEYADASRALADTSQLAKRLSAPAGSINTSEILAHVNTNLSAEVALTAFSVSRAGEKVAVTARGTAQTRESLRKFVETLKRDAFFMDARVPVSDLARDVDLSFTLTLTLRVPGS